MVNGLAATNAMDQQKKLTAMKLDQILMINLR